MNFANVTTSFINLLPSTTYYVRLRATMATASSTGATRTVTLTVPAPTGLHGTALDVADISWAWNPVAGASSYNVYPASNPVSPIATMVTPAWTEAGLSTNIAYGVQVTAVIQTFESVLSPGVTVYTLAAVPTIPVPSQVAFSSFTITWTGNQNPPTTPFEVSISSVSTFATAVSTPIAFAADFTSLTTSFINLLPGTTYYFRIRAQNGDGFASAFSAVGSTCTLAITTPTGLHGTALDVSDISWSWNPVAGASSYNVYPASNPTSPIANVVAPSWVEMNLSTNTAYGVQVTAIVGGLESALSNGVTVYTLAAVPTGSMLTAATAITAGLTWNANGNPTGTRYLTRRTTRRAISRRRRRRRRSSQRRRSRACSVTTPITCMCRRKMATVL